MSSLVCVPIMVADTGAALADAQEARSAGADLVEFRVDEFFAGEGDEAQSEAIVRLVARSPLPCIVTCRSPDEGGHYEGDDMSRIALYERLGTAAGAGEHPPRYIDVELATYTRSANIRQKVDLAVDHPGQGRDLRTSLILSLHDFHGRPADLTRRLVAMRAQPAVRVYKVAYRARSLRDNLELFDLVGESDRPMIALGMGEFGLMSRVLAPKFGAFLTFASLRPGSATAPGQPTVGELLGLYRFRSIGPRTLTYGVVGWPVGHSLSPLVHNAGFAEVGHDGVYLPLPVAVAGGGSAPGGYESFKATLGELIDHPRLDFAGCSVTIPHKENLVRLARERGWEVEPLADMIGAANTLAARRDERGAPAHVRVFNTDAPAIVGCLSRAFGSVDALRGKRIAVVGAGGVGRGAAVSLAAAGAAVEIYNRTIERAGEVAEAACRVGRAVAAEWDLLSKARCDGFINCTPLGMKGGPAEDGLPVPVRELSAGTEQGGVRYGAETVAFDTVYNPAFTPFLKEARAAGWRTIDGVEMFVGQAAGQLEAWTGRAAPRGLFERLVRGAPGGPMAEPERGDRGDEGLQE